MKNLIMFLLVLGSASLASADLKPNGYVLASTCGINTLEKSAHLADGSRITEVCFSNILGGAQGIPETENLVVVSSIRSVPTAQGMTEFVDSSRVFRITEFRSIGIIPGNTFSIKMQQIGSVGPTGVFQHLRAKILITGEAIYTTNAQGLVGTMHGNAAGKEFSIGSFYIPLHTMSR